MSLRAPMRPAFVASLLLGLCLGEAAMAQRATEPSPVPIPVPSPPPIPPPADGQRGEDELEATATLPPGFVDETMPFTWQQVVGMTFADGHLFVWERAGTLWAIEDDVLQAEPVIDIRPEVGNWGDHGMLGVALDPDYATNGYVYLLYVVDYHHASKFGTPAYDPQVDEYYYDTIARITRYTVIEEADHGLVADPGSRLVLVGEDLTTGIPICHNSHGIGSLVFGSDGTLLVSVGDAANPGGGSTSGTCVSDGIIQPKEDIGLFRAQLVDSLSGKILRLDPSNGDGVSSNPFFDALEPRAPRSRVWALGLRNPYRMTLRPGTGSVDPLAADPGTLVVGDVGSGDREEVSLVKSGGLNLGWPLFEGLEQDEEFGEVVVANLDAPNPEFGIGGCTEEYFAFGDLLVQDTLNTPFWDNPCDRLVPIAPGTPTFEHTRPILEFGHGEPARVPDHDEFGEAISVDLGSEGSPVVGEDFLGVCVTGGAFYPSGAFPAAWNGGYFFGDYGVGWIQWLGFTSAGDLRSVHEFAQVAGSVVALAVDPAGDALYYINYNDPVDPRLHRIVYVPGDLPPTAVAEADAGFGPGAIAVGFDATDSSDPEGTELAFDWDFGDGTFRSSQGQPTHVFPAGDLTPEGTIVSRLDELVPPEPMGFGSMDPEVIRDGVLPTVGSALYKEQFDTLHIDSQTFLSDKGGVDWIGYTFPGTRDFHALLFQEGMAVGELGGWFLDLKVQVRQGGTWNDVTGLTIWPDYPADLSLDYETFEISFDAISGDGIRLLGAPGGSIEYISVGELRVVGAPVPPVTLPTNYDVTLIVTDGANNADTAVLTISANNTPPSVAILEPANGSTYAFDQTTVASLEGAASDAEHGLGTLTCLWETILHHDAHIHPDLPDAQCSSQATYAPHGQDGDVYWYEVRYSVTDPLGLVGSVSHYVLPDNDRNLNGVDDADDVLLGNVPDTNHNGVPDDVETDCDGNGLPDVVDLFLGLVADRDGDGIPDPCETWDAELLPTSGPSGPTTPP